MMDPSIVQNHDDLSAWICCDDLLQEGQEGFGVILFVFLPDNLARAFNSSIYNSLTIAVIGVMWAISMICFVRGLLSLSLLKKKNVLTENES
jgi:hypothetical protein